MTANDADRERYGLGYAEGTHRWMSQRRAAVHARFLIPHLKPGMSLLDCGCGPGTISIGLAEVIAPGRLTGIDIAPIQAQRARRLAIETGAANAAFAVGDAYRLAFADGAFDAVFAHAALFHFSDHPRVLGEFRRVLRDGGVVGVRDPDYAGWRFEPSTPEVEAAQRLALLVSRRDGASPTYASRLAELLTQAGLQRVECLEVVVRNAAAGKAAAALAARTASPEFRETVLSEGWIDAGDLARIAASTQAWAEAPDVAEHLAWREAIGWR